MTHLQPCLICLKNFSPFLSDARCGNGKGFEKYETISHKFIYTIKKPHENKSSRACNGSR